MARWIYCTTRLPSDNEPVWWAIRCTAGPRDILVSPGTIRNHVPMQGAYHEYEPSYYHEYVAWIPRPEIEPAPPKYKAGFLPERNDSDEWSLKSPKPIDSDLSF